MFTILSFFLVIVLVVFFHELGHFLFARLFKVKVHAFAVGMGPALLSRTDKKGTVWKLCAIPLGGYVQMDEELKNSKKKGSFTAAKLWQRFFIILAGPVFSILLGWLLYFFIFTGYGSVKIPDYKTVGIGQVVQGQPANMAGLQKGDIITQLTVNKKEIPIQSFYDLYMGIQSAKNTEFTVKYIRNSKNNTTKIKARPIIIDEKNANVVYRIGVQSPDMIPVKLSLSESLNATNITTLRSIMLISDGLKKVFKGEVSMDELGGPVKIAQISGEQARNGFKSFLGFIAILTINLGLLNLLPIPILDGGRLILIAVEGIMRRPLSDKTMALIMGASMLIMLSLFLVITINDIAGL